MNHISDEKMQAFLDRTLSPGEEKELARHLASCRRCQELRAFYEQLYSGLAEERGFDLDENFADSVIVQLAEKKAAKIRETLLTAFLLSFGLIAVLITSSYFVDLASLLRDTESSFSTINVQTAFGWWHQTRDYLLSVISSIGAALLVVPVMLLLIMLDSYILRPRFRMAGR